MYALNLDIKNGIFEHIIYIYIQFFFIKTYLKNLKQNLNYKKSKPKATCIYKILLEPYYYNENFENECTLVKKYTNIDH